MTSINGNLISAALQKSFTPNNKKSSSSDINDCIVASARRVLSTKIEYVHCPQFSTSTFLESLKSKYTVLTPDSSKKKKKRKKKKNKHKSHDDIDKPAQMKDTELNSQNLSLPVPKVVLFSPDAVQLGWKGSVPVGSGFSNLGTTCYINSTLQALFHVPSFVNWLMDDKKHHMACEKMNGMFHTECIVCAMAKTLQISHRQNGSSFRPRHIIEKVKIICKHLSPFRQEDAHEFLRYLMEAMEKSYITILGIPAKKLDSFSKETTPLSQIFGGYIRTEVTCLECSYVSTTFQHFQDLILDIRQNSTTTVYDGLENYFSKERLDGDESYHCEHCKKKVSAYKKFSIEKAPNALCIQLKRFNISNFYGGSKISKLISISQTIDLSRFKHKKGTPNGNGTPLKYRLVSMVFHHGPSSNSGHYTALGCTSSGSYYYFNDEQVYPTHLGQYTNNPNAYIMFYELEKSSSMPENTSAVKTPVSNTVTPLSNGYLNGNSQPRSNGVFTNRENFFSKSFNHSNRPGWELNKSENNPPAKAPVAVAASRPAKPTSTSLVPYMSSDSDSSDSEKDEKTDTNNNPRLDESEDNSKSTTSTVLSPLAKKNSTLTSLLSSSPKNESSAYRVASSTKNPFSVCKPLRVDAVNSVDDEKKTTHQNGVSETKPRGFVSFVFNREKKKPERNGDVTQDNGENIKGGEEKSKSKSTPIGVATMYFPTRSVKDESNQGVAGANNVSNGDDVTHAERPVLNGVGNGVEKPGATANDEVKSTTNGWTVSDAKGNCDGSPNKIAKLSRGEWIVTDKNNYKANSSNDGKSNENREDTKRCNGNNSRGSSPVRNDFQNGSTNYSHSLNGYGAKVLTWNGDVSYLNKEADMIRKETNKRNYSFDDEQDRGKMKKPKFNRHENHSNSQSPRKNVVQQQQQQQYSNFRNKRPWGFNQNSHQYNNGRYVNNGFYRHNNYGYRHARYVHQQNGWRR